jgi:hypothetical protein
VRVKRSKIPYTNGLESCLQIWWSFACERSCSEDIGEWRYGIASCIPGLSTRWRWVVSFALGKEFPAVHWVGGWMGPRPSLDTMKKVCCSCLESNPNSLVIQPVAFSIPARQAILKCSCTSNNISCSCHLFSWIIRWLQDFRWKLVPGLSHIYFVSSVILTFIYVDIVGLC